MDDNGKRSLNKVSIIPPIIGACANHSYHCSIGQKLWFIQSIGWNGGCNQRFNGDVLEYSWLYKLSWYSHCIPIISPVYHSISPWYSINFHSPQHPHILSLRSHFPKNLCWILNTTWSFYFQYHLIIRFSWYSHEIFPSYHNYNYNLMYHYITIMLSFFPLYRHFTTFYFNQHSHHIPMLYHHYKRTLCTNKKKNYIDNLLDYHNN